MSTTLSALDRLVDSGFESESLGMIEKRIAFGAMLFMERANDKAKKGQSQGMRVFLFEDVGKVDWERLSGNRPERRRLFRLGRSEKGGSIWLL